MTSSPEVPEMVSALAVPVLVQLAGAAVVVKDQLCSCDMALPARSFTPLGPPFTVAV